MKCNEEKLNIEFETMELENIFITRYMNVLTPLELKFYLYLKLITNSQKTLNLRDLWDNWGKEKIGKALGLTDKEMEASLKSLEKKTLIEIHQDEVSITCLRNREFLVNKACNTSSLINSLSTEEITDRPQHESDTEENPKTLNDYEKKRILDKIEDLLGKPLPLSDVREIISWIEGKYTEDLILGCYEYCIDKMKTNISYIKKVLDSWFDQGIRTAEDVENYLKNSEERYSEYKKIFREIGRLRPATMAEKKLMDSWLDEEGFTIEKILECCNKSGFKESIDLRYIDKVLKNWKKKAEEEGFDYNGKEPVSFDILNQYYAHLQEQAKKDAENRRKEVYDKIPELITVDVRLKELNSDALVALSQGKKDEVMKIKKEVQNLNTKRAVLLTDNNFNIDYTDIKYKCEKCMDTGLDDGGRRCSCTKDRMGEADIWRRTAL